MTLDTLGLTIGPNGAVVKTAVASFATISFLRALHIMISPVVTFMHGIYNYIPHTNPVPTVYSVAAVLYLQSVLHVMLFRT